MRILIFPLFLLGACATNPTSYDPQHPAAAWAAACHPQPVEGLKNWVFLRCTFSNRSAQPLTFPSTQVVRSEPATWRQADANELKQLTQDLQNRKNGTGLPLVIGNGNGRLESFLGQALVLSGVWILRANSKTENFEAPGKDIKVGPGQDIEQMFVLRRESPDQPRVVVLRDKSGIFEMTVNLSKDPAASRQRPESE